MTVEYDEAECTRLAEQLDAARAEVTRLTTIGDDSRKTLGEARAIARSSDPEWLGDELFRIQQVAFNAQDERDALKARVAELETERNSPLNKERLRIGDLEDALEKALGHMESDRLADSLRPKLRRVLGELWERRPSALLAAIRAIAPVWEALSTNSIDRLYGALDTARAAIAADPAVQRVLEDIAK